MSIAHRTLAFYDRATAALVELDSLPLTVARISVGWVMVESGWGKLHNLSDVVEFFRTLGIPAPALQAPAAAGAEVLFGTMLVLGLFTRLSAIPLMVIMCVAIITAKRDDLQGISDLFGFIEYLYIVLLLVLVVRGGGTWSLDRLLVWRRSRCGHAAPTGASVVTAP
jgi:putative oxidoreductase